MSPSDLENPVIPSVFTIGHSNHPLDDFIDLLRRHDIAEVADVRSQPYSRHNPRFNREALARALEPHGIRYAYLGNELGGRSANPSCYDGGRIRYDRVSQTAAFERGIERLLRHAAQRRCALMCAEKEPLDCHRTLLVARALDERGLAVEHILADGAAEPHAEAMSRLVALHPHLRDDLLRTRKEAVQAAIAAQAKQVGHMIADGSAPRPRGTE